MTPARRTAASIVRAHIVQSGKALLARRRRGPLERWTTFGGWSEPGESPVETLRRELREELGIQVLKFQRLAVRAATWDGDPAQIAVFAVLDWRCSPRNAAPDEHEEIAWFTYDQITGLPMHEQARSEALRLLSKNA